MYEEYFGFSHDPFGITPDPRFFYENPVYHDASRSLASGIRARRGLLTLIGAAGTGKTTVLRFLMVNAEPSVRCVLADYPPEGLDALLSFACRELGLDTSASQGRLERTTALKGVLLARHAQNTTTALLLDEAQHLTEDTLEGIRLLSNLEIGGDQALQIVLGGQPELCAKLDQPALKPLKQRITLECRLDRLDYKEIGAYIAYRLSMAGYRGPELFGPDTVEVVAFYSAGIPRLINILCSNALLAARRASGRRVAADRVVEVARALRIGPPIDYRVPLPMHTDRSTGSHTLPAPDLARREPAGIRARGRFHDAGRPSTSRRQAMRRRGHPGKRRRSWAARGALAALLLLGSGVAFWHLDHFGAKSAWGPAMAVSTTAQRGGVIPELVGAEDATPSRPPEQTATTSRTATAEPAPPATPMADVGEPALEVVRSEPQEPHRVPRYERVAIGDATSRLPAPDAAAGRTPRGRAGGVWDESAPAPTGPDEAAPMPDLRPGPLAAATAPEIRPRGGRDTMMSLGSAVIPRPPRPARSEGAPTPHPVGLASRPTGADMATMVPPPPVPPPPGLLERLPTLHTPRGMVTGIPSARPVEGASQSPDLSGRRPEPAAEPSSPGTRIDQPARASELAPTLPRVGPSADAGADVDAPRLAFSPPRGSRTPLARPSITEAELATAPSPPAPDDSRHAIERGSLPPGSPGGSSTLAADQGAPSGGPVTRIARRDVVQRPSRSGNTSGSIEAPARASGVVPREVSPLQRKLIGAISQAVVSVLTHDRPRTPAGEAGLGFIVNPGGHIVTSNRVIGRDPVVVRLADGRTLPVTAVARDVLTDVAVLKIDATGLPFVGLGNSSALSVGEVVIAIGEGHGVNRQAAVGAVAATATATGGYVTIDVEIAANGSGGPLVNSRGEVIGVTVAGEVSTGSGLAVPINRAKSLLRGLGSADRVGPSGPGWAER